VLAKAMAKEKVRELDQVKVMIGAVDPDPAPTNA
jgi:hypothetical protein